MALTTNNPEVIEGILRSIALEKYEAARAEAEAFRLLREGKIKSIAWVEDCLGDTPS